MATIRLASTAAPFEEAKVRAAATRLVLLADGLGLLPEHALVERLDAELIRDIARNAISEGVAQEAAMAIITDEPSATSRARWRDLISRLGSAIEASPMPERELTTLLRTYGHEALGPLLGISPASLRRYAAGQRRIPDAVAARIHFVALVTADLAGSYNDFGLRRWWGRPRQPLDGRAPREALGPEWDPEGPEARIVAELAHALVAPGGAV